MTKPKFLVMPLRLVLLAVLTVFSGLLQAQTAHETVERVTGELFADLNANRELYRQEPQTFYDAMDRLRSEEHTSELQSRPHLVCRLLLEKKKKHKTVQLLTHLR